MTLTIQTWDPELTDLQAWDPQLGPINVPVSLHPGQPFFFGKTPGTGTLQITVQNQDPIFPAGDDYRITDRYFPLVVGNAVVQVLPGIDRRVDVGARSPGFFRVNLPNGAVFRADQPFDAAVTVEEGEKRIRLEHIAVPLADRWTSYRFEPYALPFDIVISQVTTDPGGDRVYFRPLPASILLSDQTGRYYEGLGDYIVGRRPGHADVNITLIPRNLPPGLELPLSESRFGVDVLPASLQVQVISEDDPEHNGDIVLEDRFLEDTRELIGSFRIEIRTPQGSLYNSHDRAYLEGSWSSGQLVIDSLAVENEYGDLQQVPVKLDATVINTSVATFRLVDQGVPQPEGTFSMWSSLSDLLKAVHSGSTSLRVTVSNQDDSFEYVLPGPSTTGINVPPPLVLDVRRWQDGITDVPFTQTYGSPLEIIKNQTTITGNLRNHRAISRSERASVDVNSPGQAGRTFQLIYEGGYPDPHIVQGNGGWSLHVDGLTLDTNGFIFTAWKPINEVESHSSSRVDRAARGVLPREVDVVSPADGFTTLRRQIPVRLRRARCTASALVIEHNGSQRHDRGGSYDSQPDSFDHSLQGDAGDYILHAEASNDFGTSVGSRRVRLNAARPVIDVDSLEVNPFTDTGGQGPVSPGDPLNFGNSSTGFVLTGIVDASLSLAINGNNVSIFPDPIPANATNRSDFRAVLAVSVGTNEFTLEARNEFGTAAHRITIRRREHIFELTDGVIGVERRGDSDTEKKLKGTVYKPSGDVPFRAASQILILPPAVAGQIADLFQRIKITWECVRVENEGDTDERETSTSFQVRIRLQGVITDPDWRQIIVAARVPPDWVEEKETPVAQQFWTIADEFYWIVTLVAHARGEITGVYISSENGVLG